MIKKPIHELTSRRVITIHTLRCVKEALDKYDINYWLDFGTLQGVVSGNIELIFQKKDIDFGTWHSLLPKITLALKDLGEDFVTYGPHLYPRPSNIEANVKILSKKGGMPIDICLYHLVNDKLMHCSPISTNPISRLLKYLSKVIVAPDYSYFEYYLSLIHI